MAHRDPLRLWLNPSCTLWKLFMFFSVPPTLSSLTFCIQSYKMELSWTTDNSMIISLFSLRVRGRLKDIPAEISVYHWLLPILIILTCYSMKRESLYMTPTSSTADPPPSQCTQRSPTLNHYLMPPPLPPPTQHFHHQNVCMIASNSLLWLDKKQATLRVSHYNVILYGFTSVRPLNIKYFGASEFLL